MTDAGDSTRRSEANFAAVHLGRGLKALKSGAPAAALEHIKEALRQAVPDAAVLRAAGATYLALGRPRDAVAFFRVAAIIRYDPQAIVGQARALIADGARPEAVSLLRAASDAIHEPALLRELLMSFGSDASLDELALAAHELAARDGGDITPPAVLAAVNLERRAFATAQRYLKRVRNAAPDSIDGQCLNLLLLAAAGHSPDLRAKLRWVPQLLSDAVGMPDELFDLARVLEAISAHSLTLPVLQRAHELGGSGPATRAELLEEGTTVDPIALALRLSRRWHARGAGIGESTGDDDGSASAEADG